MHTRIENLVGRTIAGYRLLGPLGRGGMSIVFLAQPLDRPQDTVAIKVLRPSDPSTEEEWLSSQARFLREAQAAHQMHHEHILPVLDYGVADDIFYIIMPVITGGTLSQRLAREHGPMPLEEIAGYLNQLASAIDYANQHGVVHRDIKPSNVLLDKQGRVYLVDFGIVRLFDTGPFAVDQAPTRLTTTGKLYGTPSYMAPERFKGEQAEPATDIYALGVILYMLVTGQLPFRGDNPIVVGMKHLNETPLPPRSLRPDLPEPAEAAILKALAKEPADRFASAGALAAAFDAGIRGQWAQELFPLPPVEPPNPFDTQVAQPRLESIVPIPEGPAQPNPLVLGPASTSSIGAMAVADAPTKATPTPTVYPQARSRNLLAMLLLGALVIGIVLLAFLLLPALQSLHSGSPAPAPTRQVHPTSTSGVPINPGITPTSTTEATPTPSPATSPTPRRSPTPSPTTSPTPSGSPTPSSATSPTPSGSPTPSPATSPTPNGSPTPTSGTTPLPIPIPTLPTP